MQGYKNVNLFRYDFYTSIAITILIFSLYLNSTTGEFVFDDWPLIKDDTLIHSLANWKTILLQGYRPVRTLLLAVLYHFFKLNPVGYHVINIIIHIFTTMAVYFLCLRLTRQRNVSIFASLIYATHPIQTDAVSYIAGMRDTLSAFFYVVGMYWFVRYRQSGEGSGLAVSIIFYTLGSFTKETAATMVFAFFLYDFVMAFPSNRSLSTDGVLKNVWKTTQRIIVANKFLYFSLFLFFCFVVYYYLFMRHSTVRVRFEGVDWYGGSTLLNYLTIPKIILYYIKQLLWPMHLLVDYKYFPIVVRDPYEPQAILSLIIVAEIILLALCFLNRHKWVAFGLLWFFLTLSPGLNILPHHEFMAEHYLYLPMVGFALVLGSVFAMALNKADSRRKFNAITLAFGVLIGGYSVRTIVRNLDWQNDLALASSQLKIRPDSVRTLMELGYLYLYMNLPQSAENMLRQSLRLTPGYGPALNDLGVVYTKYAEHEKAIEYFRLASETRVHPAGKAKNNMGVALMSIRKEVQGKAIFEDILNRDPNHRDALVSLTYTHFFNGDYEKAAEYIRRNLRNRPGDIESYFLLAEIYRKVFLFESAGKLYDIILNIEPENQKAKELKKTVQENHKKLQQVKKMENEGPLPPEGYLLLADLYIQIQEHGIAVGKLEEAFKSYPTDLELWKKYTSALFDQFEFEKAMKAAEKAIAIDPQDPEAHFLLAKAYVFQLEFDKAISEIKLIEGLVKDITGLENLKKIIEVNGPKAEMAQRLLAKNKQDPEAKLLLGDVFASMGLIDKAMEQYKTILMDSPSHKLAKYHLARMHVRKDTPSDTREALNLLRSILDEDPGNVNAHNLMGAIYLIRLDNFESAYQHFQESLRSDPNQREAERIKRLAIALEGYIRAVTAEKKYLLPFVVDKKQFERWLMPPAATS